MIRQRLRLDDGGCCRPRGAIRRRGGDGHRSYVAPDFLGSGQHGL